LFLILFLSEAFLGKLLPAEEQPGSGGPIRRWRFRIRKLGPKARIKQSAARCGVVHTNLRVISLVTPFLVLSLDNQGLLTTKGLRTNGALAYNEWVARPQARDTGPYDTLAKVRRKDLPFKSRNPISDLSGLD
jgi:hypothetical protein